MRNNFVKMELWKDGLQKIQIERSLSEGTKKLDDIVMYGKEEIRWLRVEPACPEDPIQARAWQQRKQWENGLKRGAAI